MEECAHVVGGRQDWERSQSHEWGRGRAGSSFPTGHNSVSYWVLVCGHLSVASAQLNPGSSLYLQAL